jgi:KUP system potassium uptake protein
MIKNKLSTLMLGALGVVYGDIGTGPIYTIKQCFSSRALALNADNILGITSLIIYSLAIIVSIKYLHIIFKADNKGEGGVLSLSILCASHLKKYKSLILNLGIMGGALFFSDGIITPAISVLSALEGLSLVSPKISPYIPFMATVILLFLFLIQKNGSHVLGKYFGFIMIIWFVVIGMLGLIQIIKTPLILKALNPYYAWQILIGQPKVTSLVLGATVLAITGVEALYADIGHFNKKSIRYTWNFLVKPALVLNYCGQGALLLSAPEAAVNPFYLLAPSWALYPMILLASCATIIASQSVISGIFSLTTLAINLGYLPKLRVIHTSTKVYGQVYVPFINYLLLGLTITTIMFFQNSNNLAAAYGLAVTFLMLVTTILVIVLAASYWEWSRGKVILFAIPMLGLDIVFISSNLDKILLGGALPLIVTMGIYCFVKVWRRKV